MLGLGCFDLRGAPLPDSSPVEVGGSAVVDLGEDSGSLEQPIARVFSDAVAGRIDSLLGGSLPNGRDLIERFRSLAQAGDTNCPGDDVALAPPTHSCVAESSGEHCGFASYLDGVEARDGVHSHRVDIGQVSFVITAPDGPTFSAGGTSPMSRSSTPRRRPGDSPFTAPSSGLAREQIGSLRELKWAGA